MDVPGTVGGAVVGNAGAYGGYICDSLREVTVLEADGSLLNLSAADVQFCYRGSKFKQQPREERTIVLSATLVLAAGRAKRDRRARGPVYAAAPGAPAIRSELWLCVQAHGSISGRVSDRAVWTQRRAAGNAQISPQHANFIVNLGGALASDVKALIELAQQEVKARFDLDLELEVELVGQW